MSTVAFAGAGSFCIKDTGWRHQTVFGGAASLRTFVLRSGNHGMLPTEARLPFRALKRRSLMAMNVCGRVQEYRLGAAGLTEKPA
jgi:hypothetical protein